MQGHRELLAVLLHSFYGEPMTDSFGARLRYERERRKIPLKSIAEGTKISIGFFEGLERDDVSRWPSGIFRRSFVRAYAEALGLDPDPVVREFLERYPDPLETDVAPQAATPPSASESGPLSVKLTISWSGSVHRAVVRLPNWRIVRLLLG
jgi:cytoskeletal protein RodZ